MEQEYFFSGYCRSVDGSRTVSVEIDHGQLCADCSYGSCPYEATCTIAQSIREKTNEK